MKNKKEVLQYLNKYCIKQNFTTFFNTFIRDNNLTDNLADIDLLYEVFLNNFEQNFMLTVNDTFEYRNTKNYLYSLSLIIYTEICEVTEYTKYEIVFAKLVINSIGEINKDIYKHKNTKLININALKN